jgi:hypothetical protein
MGKPSTAVAFMFAVQLVAGSSPRKDGTNNKILWVVKNAPTGFVVEGSPFGQSTPLVTVAGGPSIVDAPAAGCWSFRLSDRATGAQISTINLEVLPAGTDPVKPAA